MNGVQLQPGIYTNIFPVILPDEAITVMVTHRSNFTSLQGLRDEIAAYSVPVRVYACKNLVYGYGEGAPEFLASKGFEEDRVLLQELPDLAAHIVVESILSYALSMRFWQRKERSPRNNIGRVEIFRPEPKETLKQGIRVFPGYDLRCAYYHSVERLGLTVDVSWAYQDENGELLSQKEMYQRGAIGEAWIVQEEILRGTNRINTQVSRIIMHKYLLRFIREFENIPLSCGGQARLEAVPFGVIL